MQKEPKLLFEGACAYAVEKTPSCFHIVVFSSNSVTHVKTGETKDAGGAKRVCDRLNAYPDNARKFQGLL